MKRQMAALVMALAIAMAVLPQQTMATTVSPSPTPANGPDLVARYCDIGFENLKDRVFLIPKNGKSSYASNNLTADKSFASLMEDPIVITIKKWGGCSVKVNFSDPSVASCSVSVSRERDGKSRVTYFEIGDIKSKKAGTTRMTLAVKVGNSVKEYSCNLTFQKYQENPVKSFKLDKKNFSSAFSPQKVKVLASGEIPRHAKAKKQKLKLKKKQNKVKINVKLKKGYKLKNIWKSSYRKVKNGGYYKLVGYEKKEFWVYIEYVDKTNSVRSLFLPIKITRK